MPRRMPLLGSREARWRAVKQAAGLVEESSGNGIVVSHGPWPAAYWETFAKDARLFAHDVLSFNFTEMPGGLARRFFSNGFRNVSRFIVSSQWEHEYYADYFNIPIERIEIKHWGVQPPSADNGPPLVEGVYVCAVGSQARDYPTMIAAARLLLMVKFVIVGGVGSISGIELPPNVEFRTGIPLKNAMNIMRHSILMVLPMNSETARCGHVTAVSALHLGIPVISMHCPGLTDYLLDGDNALLMRPGDVRSMADALVSLVYDANALQRMGAAGRQFARQFCTEESVVAA